MPQQEDNKHNNNVHPNSRAARGDDIIEQERIARDQATADAKPASDTTDPDTGPERVQQLENQVADLTEKLSEAEIERDAAKEDLEDAAKSHEDALKTAGTDSDKAVKEATARAEKAEARVKELEDEAKIAKIQKNTANTPGTDAVSGNASAGTAATAGNPPATE